MNPLWSGTLLLSISAIYYSWRVWQTSQERRKRVLCERVAFMLWKMAEQTREDNSLAAGAS